jgi:signal peptidase I
MNLNSQELIELSKEMIRDGYRVRLQAAGKSMYPFIRDGDIIEIERVNVQQIKLGDIIFYHNEDRGIFAHRVIRKSSGNLDPLFITKGDANSDSGEEVKPDKILGRVITIERNGQKIRLGCFINRFISACYAKVSPLSKWIYFVPRKFKHAIMEPTSRLRRGGS